MSKLQIEELIARLEALDLADSSEVIKINHDIGRVIFGTAYEYKNFVGSIDSALTLVPEGCSVHMEIMTNRKAFCFTHNNVTATQGHAPGDFEIEKRKPPAIALCIAALKAIAAGDKQ